MCDDGYLPKCRELLISQLSLIAAEESMQVEATAVVVPAGGDDKAEKPDETPAPVISDEEAAKIKEREKEEAAFHKRLLTVPEAEVFVQLLVTIYLLDQKALDASITCASALIQRAQTFNRRCGRTSNSTEFRVAIDGSLPGLWTNFCQKDIFIGPGESSSLGRLRT
jgi:hypothetical protein